MNIILSGMPGSGKTTVAQVLKEKYLKTVYDTDAEIVKEHGKISDIFEKFGEEFFRDLETKTVEKLSAVDGAVISTGGGCLLREQNTNLFKLNGKIVYLKTRLETLYARLEGDSGRPLLQGNYKSKLEKLFEERSEIYFSSADFIIETDFLTPEEIAEKIIRLTDRG